MITEELLNFKIIYKDGKVKKTNYITKKDYEKWQKQECEICQSTAMYDKNGKLIFDGDFVFADVEFDEGRVQFKGVVHYESGAYYVVGSDYVCALCNNSKTIEVINEQRN